MDIGQFIKNHSIVLATLAIIVGMLLLSSYLFKGSFDNARIIFKEEPMVKNKQLQLVPGESYIYAYYFNNTSVNVTYDVFQGPGCIGVKLRENLNSSPVCLDSGGNDETGYNTTFGNPAIIFFRPWMLALNENWRWNSSMYLTYGGSYQLVSETDYRVIRMDEYQNRSAYLVEVKSSSGPIEYQWIDSEKRILLKIEGEQYKVELVSGGH